VDRTAEARKTGQSSEFIARIFSNQLTGVTIALILILLIASIFSPYFLSAYNVSIVIRSLAFVGLVAIGQCLLLILGDLDLSVGAIAGLCAITGGKLMVDFHLEPFLALLLTLAFGMVLGFINGAIVTGLNLNSLVVTIGMSGVYAGANLVITKGKAIIGIPAAIHFLGRGDLFGVPVPFLIMVLVLLLVCILTMFTPFGRYMYAIGNSRDAARILGIKVNRIRIISFMLTGFLAALAGMLMVARLGSSQPSIGEVWVLTSIAAPVIGGVATTGGVGNPVGAIIGAAIIGVIENIIVLFGVSPYWQTVVSGAIVVLAVSLDAVSRLFFRKV
jgi:ribose transport system permease protein